MASERRPLGFAPFVALHESPNFGQPLPVGIPVLKGSEMIKKISAAVLAPLALVAAPAAFAQNAVFTSELAAITTDVTSYGGALVILCAVGVTFMIAMKYIRKLRGAA
jgi:hypothetical protein